MNLLATVAADARTRCRLRPTDQPLLLGVSGGLDSIVLLEALYRLGYRLIVAHFNHGLRQQAEADARFVAAEAARRNLPFVLGSGPVRAQAENQGNSLEAIGRQLRYRFLFAQARRYRAQAVVVAHQADDQAETVLLHLLRGSGLTGLGGMAWRAQPNAWDAEIPLVRPLLGLSRQDIRHWAGQEGLRWREDDSNTDRRFTRNRLRLDVMPLLATFNPGLTRSLWRLAETARAEDAWLQQLTGQAARQIPLRRGPGWLAIPLEKLREHPLALQRRLWRAWWQELTGAVPTWETVETLRQLAQNGGQRSLPGNWQAWRAGDTLWLARGTAVAADRQYPALPPLAAAGLRLPGTLSLGEGWQLRARAVAVTPALWQQVRANRNAFRAWADADRVGAWLVVRRPQPGDRFRPLGLGGSIKLQDVFVNLKIPARVRASWPLLGLGADIGWVPGYRLATDWALQPESRRAWAFHLERRSDV